MIPFRFLASSVLAILTATPAGAQISLAGIPLAFEANRGQHPETVAFVSRGRGYTLFLTPTGTVMTLARTGGSRPLVVRTSLVGARAVRGEGRAPFSGRKSYLVGNRDDWVQNVPLYREAGFAGVYRGIDLVYHGRGGSLEYDFVVAAGADPSPIALSFDGADRVELAADGALLVHAGGERVRHDAPVAYQRVDGAERAVAARWRVGGNVARFVLGDYDRSRELVIDPVLVYSTYLGGNGYDQDSTVVADSAGSAIVFGYTTSTDFPLKGEVQGKQGSSDCFLTKFTPDGKDIVWSTILGSTSPDQPGETISIGPGDSVAVCARAGGKDWPTTSNAYMTTSASANGAVVTLLTKDGKLSYSTYLKGEDTSTVAANACAVDPKTGVLWLAGWTSSTKLPVTAGAFQNTVANRHTPVYVAKFDPRLSGKSSLLACTYLGGPNQAVEYVSDMTLLDGRPCLLGRTNDKDFPTKNSIQAYAGGNGDAFVTVLDAALTRLDFSTFLGGSGLENRTVRVHIAGGIATTSNGCIWVGGETTSTDFPLTPDAIDKEWKAYEAFLCRIDPRKSGRAALEYSSFLGGDGLEVIQDLVVDDQDRVWISGQTGSLNFPRVHSLQEPRIGPADPDAFLACLDATGKRILFSSHFGGRGHEQASGLALGPGGSVFFTGTTGSANDLPVTPGAYRTQAPAVAAVYCARVDVAFASRVLFGMGHPGKLGVPAIGLSAEPVLGTNPNLELGSSTDVVTGGIVLIGAQRVDLPTPFGGRLLTLPFVTLSVVVAPNGLAVPFPIPADRAFCGQQFVLQHALIDTAASRLLAFSRGLALTLGI